MARPTDWSVVSLTRVPRLKVEYQLLRSVFLRLVGQYAAQEQDDLRDDGRTDAALLQFDSGTASYTPITAWAANDLQLDWLSPISRVQAPCFSRGMGARSKKSVRSASTASGAAGTRFS